MRIDAFFAVSRPFFCGGLQERGKIVLRDPAPGGRLESVKPVYPGQHIDPASVPGRFQDAFRQLPGPEKRRTVLFQRTEKIFVGVIAEQEDIRGYQKIHLLRKERKIQLALVRIGLHFQDRVRSGAVEGLDPLFQIGIEPLRFQISYDERADRRDEFLFRGRQKHQPVIYDHQIPPVRKRTDRAHAAQFVVSAHPDIGDPDAFLAVGAVKLGTGHEPDTGAVGGARPGGDRVETDGGGQIQLFGLGSDGHEDPGFDGRRRNRAALGLALMHHGVNLSVNDAQAVDLADRDALLQLGRGDLALVDIEILSGVSRQIRRRVYRAVLDPVLAISESRRIDSVRPCGVVSDGIGPFVQRIAVFVHIPSLLRNRREGQEQIPVPVNIV